jgi:hypothetical protein
MALSDTAWFKLLVETNDKQKIAEMIATDLLAYTQLAFELMAEYGYNGKENINAAAVYDVAEQIVKLKTNKK